MMGLHKTFVDRRRDLTKEEREYISFANYLAPLPHKPLTLIIGKRGGVKLAVVTLLIWLFPACFPMGYFPYCREPKAWVFRPKY